MAALVLVLGELSAERKRFECLAGDHLQLAALAGLGSLEPLDQLVESLHLPGAEPVRAALLERSQELGVPDVAAEPARDEGDETIFGSHARVRAR
jgi:hypothetical protein